MLGDELRQTEHERLAKDEPATTVKLLRPSDRGERRKSVAIRDVQGAASEPVGRELAPHQPGFGIAAVRR
jgi:hypothetical protein